MNWYKCFISGENFPGALIGEKMPIGFYITRFIQADSPEEAENIALSNLKQEKALKLPDDISRPLEAKVYFEEIVEITKNDVPDIQAGFTFYVMGT